MGSSSEEIVYGKALLEAAIAEAELRVVGLDGGLLAASRQPLGEQGVFSIAVAGLPADFRVEVEDLSSREVLREEVRGFQPGRTLVFPSPLSNLVGAYLDRHPEAKLDAATAAVKAHLAIPDHANLGYDLADEILPQFDLAAYRADARSRGGLAAQEQALLDLIDAGAEASAFPPATPRLGGHFGNVLIDTCLGSMVGSAAQTVASSLGAPGWMMSLLGGKNEDEIKGKLAEIQNQVAEQKRLLVGINTQITTLTTAVDEVRAALVATEEIKAYKIGAGLLGESVSKIKAIQNSFRYIYDHNLANPTAQELRSRTDSIAAVLTRARTEMWVYLTQLHDVLVGTPVVEGLIPLWVRTVGRNQPGFPDFVDHTVLDGSHRQLDLYAGYQVTGLQMLIEAFHAQTPVSSRLAQKTATALTARLQQQLEIVGGPANLDDQLIIDRRSDAGPSLMWHKKGSSIAFTYNNRPPGYIGVNEPIGYVAGLRTGGYGGWRLPTKAEVTALIRGKDGRQVGEWLDAQGFRVKDATVPRFNWFLLAEGVAPGRPVGEYELWDSYTGRFAKVKDLQQLVVFRVLPVRQVWPTRPVQLRGLVDAGFRFLAKKIASGIGSKVGKETTGWILRSLGANTADPVIDSADNIRQGLADQKKDFIAIGARLEDVTRRVTELKNELLDLGDKTTYDTLARVLQIRISKILAIHELLGWMAEADPGVSNHGDVQAILAMIDRDIPAVLIEIHDALLPDGVGLEGLLPQWRRRTANRMVRGWSTKDSDPDPKKRPQFFDKAFLDVINDQWDYYYAVQVIGLQLRVEAAHASSNLQNAREANDEFKERIEAQEKLVIGPRLPDDRFLYNDRSKSLWAKAPLCPSGRSGRNCFEWTPAGGGTFTYGDPAATLAAFAKPAGFDCRFLTEADWVGKADLVDRANTFREIFTQAGFADSFDVPIWLSTGTRQRPARMAQGFVIDTDVTKAFVFSVLPVCTAIPEPE